jgi:hypothetical protein
MPRDGNGTYILPLAPVKSGEIIEALWANDTTLDLANAMTDSLSRKGDGGMLVPLGFAAGSAGTPGITWNTEPTTGLFLNAPLDMQVTLSGTPLMRFFQEKAWVRDITAGVWRTIVTQGDVTGGSGQLPLGNTTGDLLSWDNDNTKWVSGATAGSLVPPGNDDEDALVWDAGTSVWESRVKTWRIPDGPSGSGSGYLLQWTGLVWAAQPNPLPEPGANGNILTSNGTLWASEPPAGTVPDGGANQTLVWVGGGGGAWTPSNVLAVDNTAGLASVNMAPTVKVALSVNATTEKVLWAGDPLSAQTVGVSLFEWGDVARVYGASLLSPDTPDKDLVVSADSLDVLGASRVSVKAGFGSVDLQGAGNVEVTPAGVVRLLSSYNRTDPGGMSRTLRIASDGTLWAAP